MVDPLLEGHLENPKLTIGLTDMYNVLIAKRNISAEIYKERQQEDINILEKEYQTRFGGLSQYLTVFVNIW